MGHWERDRYLCSVDVSKGLYVRVALTSFVETFVTEVKGCCVWDGQ